MSKMVYALIKSLSTREKAHFKRFSQISSDREDKNYLVLYSVLEKMKTFDLSKLQHSLKGSTIEQYLSSESNYLFEQILRSLMIFHIDIKPISRVNKMITFIELLIEKNQRKKALKMLKHAKKIAYHHEEFTTIMKLIQLEEDILFDEGILGFTEKLYTLQSERELLANKISTVNHLRILREQIRELQFQNIVFTENDLQQFPLTLNENTISLKAKDSFLYIKAIKHYLLRQHNISKDTAFLHLEFLCKNEHIFNKNKILPIISNCLYFCALVGDVPQFNQVLQILEPLKSNTSLNQIYIEFIFLCRQLEIYYTVSDETQTAKLINETGFFIENNIEKLGKTQIDYSLFLIVRATIFTKKFNDTHKWLEMWYYNGVLDSSIIRIKLFTLIFHFEEGLLTLLEAEVKSVYNYFYIKKINNQFVKVILKFFSSYVNKPSDVIIHLCKLESRLLELEQDSIFIKLTEDFRYLEWCREKIDFYKNLS